MNVKTYVVIFSDYIQSNSPKMIGWCFAVQMDNDQNYTVSSRVHWIFFSGKSPTNKQQLKTGSVKDRQKRKETQHLVMAIGFCLQRVQQIHTDRVVLVE